MLVNRESVAEVYKGLKAEFNNAFSSASVTWDKIAMLVESTASIEEYPWIDNVPQMREWVTERTIKPLQAYSYQLRNQDWESTIEIDRNDIEDERLGMYANRARSAGFVAATWPDQMVYNVVDRSFDDKCHDGQPFISDLHPYREGTENRTFSNRIRVALDSSSLAAAMASFGAAQTALMKMKAQDGQLMGLMPGALIVPPGLKAVADLLMSSDVLGGDDPNPYKDAAQVVCSARLTSDKRWWLTADDSVGMKPFIWQERKKALLEMVQDPTDHFVFMNRKVLLGVSGRGVAGYSLPQLIIGSDPA